MRRFLAAALCLAAFALCSCGADEAETVPVPETTATERCGSHRSVSRCQLSFRLAGQTTTAG